MARHPAPVNIRRTVRAPFWGVLLLAPVLAGCNYMPPLPERPRDVFTTPRIPRGHAVTEEQLAQVTPGVSTRNDVQAALGSPSQSGTFTDDVWYYISGVTQLRPARALALRSQKVVVVKFDDRGTVQEVRELTDADMPRVDFVSRETPTPGNDRSILQALFGNIGRFGPTPGGGVGADGMSGTGAPAGAPR
ncbi:outer membrane protein assembly factor BamE [Roseococcus sp. YIM B11640]|uniref:outer membrane protein assembly factor BamE n=1 Tax=Roseococcus sp. YIM B11640 TaxID=3133973 RepID=UPI003C7E1F9E